MLLSSRESPERWYQSMDRTVLEGARRIAASDPDEGALRGPWHDVATPEQARAASELWRAMFTGAFADSVDPYDVIAAYERHLTEVRAAVPAHRLLEWTPGDGWQPLCAALDVPVPDEPFPHETTAAEMRARLAEMRRGETAAGRGRAG